MVINHASFIYNLPAIYRIHILVIFIYNFFVFVSS